ncbi:MAG: type II/IV secretion system ATPase subunit [Candidatus Aenigmarchaeota archaeon]|nr:type II/IV secretion system ATPase subunit [Candidatus Aenigmarchaeota archaeon]
MKRSSLAFKKLVEGYKKTHMREAEFIIGPGSFPLSMQAAPQQQEEEKPKEVEGFSIPHFQKGAVKIGSLEAAEEGLPLSISYPLIPRHPSKGEPIFAYAKISWDDKNSRYFYNLVEPVLTPKIADVYGRIKEMLEQRLNVDFTKIKKIEAKKFLNEQINDIIKVFNFAITPGERTILKYYIQRDFIGLGALEPLMRDPNIEDISCDGVGIPVFVFHRNTGIGSIATNIVFNDPDELDSFLMRLAQLSGKSISVASPLLNSILVDGSRIQGTLGTDIARRGSNFTIRKFTEEPLTPAHLMNYGTVDSTLLAYLWFVVDYGKSVLVSGGTATGKTSLLNVISLFIRPEKKIVSIEDTGELRLPHSHWVPSVARTVISAEGSGEIGMFELLRESLRQRPDYIIVGEVRGKEAYILFQQMSTGHPSLGTIHAENMEKLIDRLTTAPISLPPVLISSLDVVLFLARLRYRGKFARKVVEAVEMIDFNMEKNKPNVNYVSKWNPRTDKFDILNKSILLKQIADMGGLAEKDIRDEIERRILILEWMKARNIVNYKDVHKILAYYYANPEKLLYAIQGAA